MALTEQMQKMVQQDIEDAATRPKEDILKEQIEGLKTFGKTARDVAIESIPGVGEAIAEQRVKEAQEAGDKVGTAIEMAAMGVGAIPGVGDIVAQGIRRLKSGKIKPKPTAVSGEYYDAPSYGEFHQRAAQADREEGIKELEALRATENPTTGIFQETIQKANIGNTRGQTAEVNNVSFNPQELQNIKGLMGEDAFRDTGGKLELLEKRIAEEGYQPSNITIVVREDGTPFIQEGNHRLVEALKSGREEIKADIVYLRNAEKTDGPFNPERLNDPETDVDLLVRTSYEMENAPITTAAKRTTKSPLRVLFDKLPETERTALPPQPDENRLFGYHGTAKAREADEPFFDINFARKNDQFLGEGFYFTLDPEVASEYASIRGIKSERQIKGEQAKKILADENVIPSERGKKGSGTSVEVTPQGEYVTGGSMMKGQDIYGNPVSVGQYIGRFDLSNLEKPYVVRTEKQRKELKKMIPQLKEEGYDSILFADFKDRSKQIMVFPEHMDKINSDAINYAQGGAVPMKEQMEMFEDGGLKDEGGTIDPVSGNDVPPGSTQEEVRDDIPAQLSEGEFVFPADVVRYWGLDTLMRMRQQAKMGLRMMEEMGQMGNSEEATIPDDVPFDINDLDMDEEEEYNMAVGGMVPAQQQTPATTGVVYQAPQFQPGQTQVGQAAAPIPMAQVARPQQQQVPVYQPPETLPSPAEFVKAPEGQAPQTIVIVNSETGEERTITFIPGVTQIPQGFVRKEDYVPKEVVPETPTTGVQTATVTQQDDDKPPQTAAEVAEMRARVDAAKKMGIMDQVGFSVAGAFGKYGPEDVGKFTPTGYIIGKDGVLLDPLTGMTREQSSPNMIAGIIQAIAGGKEPPKPAYSDEFFDAMPDTAKDVLGRSLGKEARDRRIEEAEEQRKLEAERRISDKRTEEQQRQDAIAEQREKAQIKSNIAEVQRRAREEMAARESQQQAADRARRESTERQEDRDRGGSGQTAQERADSYTASAVAEAVATGDYSRGFAEGGLAGKPKPKAKKMKRGGLASKKQSTYMLAT